MCVYVYIMCVILSRRDTGCKCREIQDVNAGGFNFFKALCKTWRIQTNLYLYNNELFKGYIL